MFKFRLFDLLHATWALEVVQEESHKKRETASDTADIPLATKIADSDLLLYKDTVNLMREQCERLELESTLDQLERIDTTLELGALRGAYSTFTNQVQQVWECLKTDLDKRVFIFITPVEAKYHKQERLFGNEIYESFPDARSDIQDAGNCLSVGLYTASVFHLMRVAEFGLRKLAKRLHVKLTDKGKPLHVEYATWDKVITGCKKQIDSARQLPMGKQKDAKLNLYSDSADHCLFMKDVWRNNISHTRKPYSHHEAMAVLERVRDFMRFLSASF